MLQLSLADDCCEAIHMRLTMMQIMLCAYNVSSQLVSIIKSTFVEDSNSKKVMRVSMVNPYQFNGMEAQGFPSTKPPTLFRST